MRSASVIASAWSCVTYTNVAPSRSCSFFSSARTPSRSAASRFESGSSRRNTFGRRTSARPERDALALAAGEGRRAALEERREAEQRGDLAPRAPRSRGAGRPPPRAGRRGSGARSCAGRARSSGTPSRRRARAGRARSRRGRRCGSTPAVGASRPATSESRVDFPQPDGPDHRDELAVARRRGSRRAAPSRRRTTSRATRARGGRGPRSPLHRAGGEPGRRPAAGTGSRPRRPGTVASVEAAARTTKGSRNSPAKSASATGTVRRAGDVRNVTA